MHISQSAIFDCFLLLTVLSIFLERSLALVFEQKYIKNFLFGKPIKDIIAFGVCFFVCKIWCIDVISMMLEKPESTNFGYFLTSLAIAGGSKASIKLFQDVLGLKKKEEF